MATPLDFAKALLNRLGLPQTENRLVGLVAFEKKEGGHYFNGARFNPLNTCRGVPGSQKWGGPGCIQVFPSWQAGVEATALTMVQGNMRALLDALKANAAPIDFLKAVTHTPWCPQSEPSCGSYATGNPYADYNAYANHADPVGGSIADTGGPGVVGWVKDHPWITASVVLLAAGGAAYYFQPQLFRGFPSARRLLARENPVDWKRQKGPPGGEGRTRAQGARGWMTEREFDYRGHSILKTFQGVFIVPELDITERSLSDAKYAIDDVLEDS